MGAFGQVTVNDAMVGKYTSEEWRSRAYAVRYFIGFTAAGVSVGLVAWLYEQGGFVTMLHAFAGLCLLVIAAAIILPAEMQGAGGGSEQSMSVLRDPELESLLAGLHARSDEQAAAMRSFDARRDRASAAAAAKEARAFLSDKLVALDRDKAEFCYQLCRANDARRIVRDRHILRGLDALSRGSRARQCSAPAAATAW